VKTGELKRRRKAKALRLLNHGIANPRFTTAEALCLIDASCGSVKFHRILFSRGLATPVKGFEKGYHFSLPSTLGASTFSIKHFSFHWSPPGVVFIASLLGEEGIECKIPAKLAAWIDTK